MQHGDSAEKGSLSEGHLNCGQVGGLIKDIPSVKELLDNIMQQTDAVLNRVTTQLT